MDHIIGTLPPLKMPLPEPHALPDDQIYLPNLFLHSKINQTLKKAI